MTKTILIKDLNQYESQTVTIEGWVYNFRSSGKIAFWQMRDGSATCQAILSTDELTAKQWDEVQKVTLESSVKLTGKVTKHPKFEQYEIQVTDFSFYQIAAEYPISKKGHGIDFLLDQRHLWLRSSR